MSLLTSIDSLHDLYVAQLKDLYYAEQHLVKALTKMKDEATDAQLASAFTNHLSETEVHVERLEQIFDMLDMSSRSEKCEAIKGILAEAKELMSDSKKGDVLDAALILAGQKAEHYEIATYGTLIIYAETLGYNDQATILKKTLAEEKAADAKLTQLAEGGINAGAKIAAKKAA